MISSLKSAWQQ